MIPIKDKYTHIYKYYKVRIKGKVEQSGEGVPTYHTPRRWS